MGILCTLLGHKPPKSVSKHAAMGGGDYLVPAQPHRDNLGRVHLHVYGDCPRCGERYQVGMMHLHSAMDFAHLHGDGSDE
ncbi:hypothetical protein [Pseudomonas sp.]|uniref:hypothetical protein n=1 Tax=Pseudomonas sp. TaxID=306 RepID=UPI0031E3EA45